MIFRIFASLLLFPYCITTSTQPNIIYILSDDLGHADVGFTNGNVETPTLNQMAREGVVLTQHYVQQVCTPTRGALMSGRYPIHTGLQHDVIYPGHPWGLPLDETILPQVLKEYNYSTHAVGKWHLGMHKWAYTPLYRGFDDFFGYYLGAQNYLTHINSKGKDLRSDYWDENGKFVDTIRFDLDGQYSTELYASYVQDLLMKTKTQENPFFIYMAFQNVHAPHMVPQSYIDRFSSHIVDKKEQVFAAMVSAMDEAISNITQTLKATGQADNTVIVFSSDNGGNVNCVRHVTSSNYPYRGGKRAMYEGGIRSPSFVWAPGRIRAGSTSNAMIHVTDWLPTFWGLASLQGALEPNNPISTKPIDGVNQWGAISENLPSNRTEFIINIDMLPVACGHHVPTAAVRWNEWKLILGSGGPPSGWYPAPNLGETGGCGKKHHDSYVELYNIEEDPSETKNMSGLYPDIVHYLTEIIHKYNATMVPMGNKPHDPASNPARFNHTWMPWMDMEDGAHVMGTGGDMEGPIQENAFVSKDIWLMGNELTPTHLDAGICFIEDNNILEF